MVHFFQRHAEPFFEWLIRTSWQAAILVLIVAVAQLLFKRWLTPRWRYALWMLVLVRLSLPSLPESSWSVFNLYDPPHLIPPAGSTVNDASAATAPRGVAVSIAEMPFAPRSHATASASASPYTLPRRVIVLGWLAVALLMILRMMWGHYRLSRRVCKQRPITRQDLLDVLEDCKEEMDVHIPINVLESPLVKSPALLGFVRPRLLLPQTMVENFTREELRLVFLHELAHVRRLDIPVNWWMNLLHVLHWFNPFVWFALYRIRCERELACDSLVLSRRQEKEILLYGETMLKLIEFSSASRLLPGVVGILEDRNELKHRMRLIAQYSGSTYGWSAAAILLLLLIGGTTLTSAKHTHGTWSQTVKTLNLDFEDGVRKGATRPIGWLSYWRNGYEMAADSDIVQQGRWSVRIHYLKPGRAASGTATQWLQDPSLLAGKRISVGGYIKTEDVENHAGLYVEAMVGSQVWAYNDMSAEKINGTRDWGYHSFELDVPAEAEVISFGALLRGKGTMWADNLQLTIVGDSRDRRAASTNTPPVKELPPHIVQAREHYEKGASLCHKDLLKEAVEEFKKAVALEPDSAAAWAYLGWAATYSPDIDLAEKAYTRSIELNPTNHFTRYGLGDVAWFRKDFEKAVERYSPLVTSDYPMVHGRLTRAALLTGRMELAADSAEKLVEMTDSDFDRKLLGAAQQGQLDADLRSLIESEIPYPPGFEVPDTSSLREKGWSLLAAQKSAAAMEQFLAALARTPRDADAHHGLGWCLVRGDVKTARMHFEKTTEMGGKNARSLLGLGLCQKALGENRMAVDTWKESLDLQPDFHEATDQLAVTLLDMGEYQEAAPYLDQLAALPPAQREQLKQLRERMAIDRN